ncbi:hypothetical protein AB0I84_38730 [Streptomyces spectabilis]|uniref:hypothetical protein n=1 Tax=Streptomyces spectabilis TaxID=68270 RepID=UPI0033D10201
MTRRFNSAEQALAVQENDLKCAERARKWGMTDSAEHWQQNADQAWDQFLEITERTANARKER